MIHLKIRLNPDVHHLRKCNAEIHPIVAENKSRFNVDDGDDDDDDDDGDVSDEFNRFQTCLRINSAGKKFP